MPSPATVTFLFVVLLVGTAASAALPLDLFGKIATHLEDFSDVVALAQSCRAVAENTAAALSVGRLFYDKRLQSKNVFALANSVCLHPDPDIQKMVHRETIYDTVVSLVDRLMFVDKAKPFTKTTESEILTWRDTPAAQETFEEDTALEAMWASEIAKLLSLMIRTWGQVYADAISGTLALVDPDQPGFERICQIYGEIQGLDFTSALIDVLPEKILNAIQGFVSNPISDEVLLLPPVTAAIQSLYVAPFNEIFPQNYKIAQYLLAIPDVCELLGSRALVLDLMRFGIRFDAPSFFYSVRVNRRLVTELYPLLRNSWQSSWVRTLEKLIELDSSEVIEALFRMDDFVDGLRTASNALPDFQSLCITSLKKGRRTIFMILARQPLMSDVLNLRFPHSADSLLNRSTLLHLAVRLNCYDELNVLLSFPQLDIGVLDGRWRSPLHYAWRVRLRRALLRNIKTRSIVDGYRIPRMNWLNHFLLDMVF